MMDTTGYEDNFGEYIYRQCLDYLSKLDTELRMDIYVLAFNINNVGGEDENQKYVDLDTINFHANTRAHAQECSAAEPADLNVWWVLGLFIGLNLLKIPQFESQQPLNLTELLLRDQWCAAHGVLPTGTDEAGRSTYNSGVTKAYYAALAEAAQYAAIRLHQSGDLTTYIGKPIPILISYDGGCEGILSVPATKKCNPPEVLVEFLEYATSIENRLDYPYQWTVNFEDER